jgi:hypothetical protein
MQCLYHVLSLREPVFIRPAELGGIQQVFLIKCQARYFEEVLEPSKPGNLRLDLYLEIE